MADYMATKIRLDGENRTQQAFNQIQNSIKGLASEFSVFKDFELDSMLGLSGTMAAVFALSAALSQTLNTADKLQGIESAFEAITGSSGEAEKQLVRIREQADLLGQDYLSLADLTKQWMASTKGTAIENAQEEVLQGFLSYGAVLKIPEEQLQRIVTALSQMASKGKIYAEELRGQLGEALPGAFNLLAKSMKVSTDELNKMLEDGEVGIENLVVLAKDLQKEYGDKVGKSTDTVTNNLVRGKNELVEITQLVLDSTGAYEAFNEAVKTGVALLRGVKVGIQNIADFSTNLGQVFEGNLGVGEFLSMPVDSNAELAEYYRSVFGQLDVLESKKAKLKEEMRKTPSMSELVWGSGIINTKELQDELQALEEREKELFSELDREFERGLSYQSSALSLFAEKPEKKKSDSELKKEQKAREQTLRDLERLNGEIAKLTMTEGEYREFSLAKEIEEYSKKLPFATEEIKLFAEAKRNAWAKEDEKAALEKQKENLDVQAKFYEDLAQKLGIYNNSLEFQNRLIDEQVQVWKNAEIPEEYIQKMEEFLRLEVSRNPLDNFMLGVQETFTEYGSLATQMKDVYKSAFSEMSNALTEWASGADVSFSEVAQSFTKMLLQMSINYTMSNLASGIFGGTSSLFGGLFGGGTNPGESLLMAGVFHEGGMAYAPHTARAVSGDLFANAPRYHNGYNPSFEQPAILRKDERVLSPLETIAYNNGLARGGESSSVQIYQNITVNGSALTDRNELSGQDYFALQKQIKDMVRAAVLEVLAKEKRQGGMLGY